MTRQIPYNLKDIKNFKEIENIKQDFFDYNKRRKIWNLFSIKVLELKFKKKEEEELFRNFSQIANQYITFLIAMYTDIGGRKNLKSQFRNLNSKQTISLLFKTIKNEGIFNIKKVNKFRISLRDLSYKNFNFNAPTIHVLDHNMTCNYWIKNNKDYKFKYTPSNNYNYFSKKDFFFSNKIILNDIIVNDLTNKIFKISLDIFDRFNNNLTIKVKFKKIIYDYIKLILSNIKYNSDNLNNSIIPKLAISNISGYLPSRIISNRIIRQNGKVIRFQHGAGILKGNRTSALLNDFNSCNIYYFNNEIELKLANSIFGNKLKNIINFKKLDLNNTTYKNKNSLPVIKKNNIKLIYSPSNFDHNRMPGPGNIHPIDYLKCQNKIVNFLSKYYSITYQPHPNEKISNKNNPINKFRNNINFFEKQLILHDVFIFDSYISSTFWVAINESKPIILLEYFSVNDNENYFIKNLKNRCAHIKLKQNMDLNKLNFSKLIQESYKKTRFKKDFGFFL